MKSSAVSRIAKSVALVACFAIGTTAGIDQEPEAQAQESNDFFHGNQDEGVPVEHPRRLVAALRDAGGSPGYTELLPTVEWTSHGFTTEQRDTIRAAFQDGVDQGAIPGGSLLLVHGGEVVFREAFGVDDLDTHRVFPLNARCRLASVTKPHSATVLAILADRGRLSLEDPIDKYLPEFSQIKVRGKGLASSDNRLMPFAYIRLPGESGADPRQPGLRLAEWNAHRNRIGSGNDAACQRARNPKRILVDRVHDRRPGCRGRDRQGVFRAHA